MAPKFRGNSEDWLDHPGSSFKGRGGKSGRRPKIKASARSLDLEPDLANAVVVEVFQNQCRVRWDADSSEFLCNYRRAEVVGKTKGDQKERTPVAVGDRVLVKQTGARSGIIEGITRRRNQLSRLAPGQRPGAGRIHHVISANMDLLVVVSSAKEPQFSPGVVDRFLVAAEAEKIPVLILISKGDLLGISRPWMIYEKLGYSILEISVKSGAGMAELKKRIDGKSVVFCGHSGVGKTSLLRSLLNQEVGRVAEISEATGKGRHTTTGAVMYIQSDSHWIDTPGIREFSLPHVQPEELKLYFPEFRSLICESKACLHLDEPGCSVIDRGQSLDIHSRYASYRNILQSLLEIQRPSCTSTRP